MIRSLQFKCSGFILFAFIFCSPLHCEAFSDYGGFCNSTVRCDSSAYLSCQDEKCKCIRPDSMVYDEQISQCVAQVGEKCRYTVGNGVDGSFWFETVGCVKFAVCDGEQGICTCLPNFVDHQNGTCSERGGFGAECQTEKDCRIDLSLSCVNESCQCDPEFAMDSLIAFGNNFTRQCVGLAGKPCLNHKCTLNAHCPDIYFGPDGPPPPHFVFSDGIHHAHAQKCRCIPPFTPTADGHCLASHGYPCGNLNKCADGFACIDRRCQCKHPLYQIYDQFTGTCQSLVWGPCKNTEMDIEDFKSAKQVGPPPAPRARPRQCTEGASCVENKKLNISQCECEEGFIENDQGRCDLTFGAPCDGSRFRCDQLTGLSCRSGKCGCLDDFQLYHPEKRKCLGLVGSICTTPDSCAQNASCGINLDSKGRPGARKTCACLEGYQISENRTCA